MGEEHVDSGGADSNAAPNERRPSPRAATSRRYQGLRDRFQRLWTRCVPGADAATTWDAISSHYSQAYRKYHGLGHLERCFDEFDQVSEHMAQPDRVECALWMHDVIYESGRQDNEARSAELFRRLLGDHPDRAFAAHVTDMILATAHRVPPSDPDTQILCDIDLASLGYPWEVYLQDSLDLKSESKSPPEYFLAGQRAFLQGMLARPRIFLTPSFNANYELRARENMRRYIEILDRERV